MPIVTNGLIGYWHYNQGVNGGVWENISPNTSGQYNGTIYGATVQNGGMFFDGTDDHVIMEPLATSSLSNMEIEIYLSEVVSGAVYGHDSSDLMASSTNSNYIISSSDGHFGTPNYDYTPPNGDLVPVTKINFSIDFNLNTHRIFVDDVEITGVYENNYDEVTFHKLDAKWVIGNVWVTASFEPDVGVNDFNGIIHSFKIYDHELTDSERSQNSSVGTGIGLSAPEPPVVTIDSISETKISDETGADVCEVTFSFDQDVDQWTVNVLGTDHASGTIADSYSGTTITAGTLITAEIDWTEGLSEGSNRINIYGKNLSGSWTPYAG